MAQAATVVLDVGKTLSKLGLWDENGQLLERRTWQNQRVETPDYVALDAINIEAWLIETLSDFARIANISDIIPVGHGAAAVIVRGGRLAQPPMDYESPIPIHIRREYEALRDPFSMTGSPSLPDGLNLGAQLFYLQSLDPKFLQADSELLPWPQYWSWLLSGVTASELTSLGCHTDLWQPLKGAPSTLAQQQGWAQHLAPIRPASAALGPIAPALAARTGLPRDVKIRCGLHDSNAALIAARGFTQITGADATVLSTGTWFIAMRTALGDNAWNILDLDASRDCLVNVDAFGTPLPSSRFMGGREIELLTGLDARRVDIRPDQPALLGAVSEVIRDGSMVLPTLAPGTGPFPHGRGNWIGMPTDDAQRRAAVCLYAALVADGALDLIGARDYLLIEGRFVDSEVFVRALATLRPRTAVYRAHSRSDVSSGALRLLNPQMPVPTNLDRVLPLPEDLRAYRDHWRQEAERMERAAS